MKRIKWKSRLIYRRIIIDFGQKKLLTLIKENDNGFRKLYTYTHIKRNPVWHYTKHENLDEKHEWIKRKYSSASLWSMETCLEKKKANFK